MAEKTQKYKALVLITHTGHNKYYAPVLKRGQKETFPSAIRGTEFDLDHQDEDGIVILVRKGAVIPVAPIGKYASVEDVFSAHAVSLGVDELTTSQEKEALVMAVLAEEA